MDAQISKLGRAALLGLVLGAAVLAGGCADHLNNEHMLGQTWLPPTFDPSEGAIVPVTENVTGPIEPSITSLDRSGWALTRYEVPNDLAAHQPRYTNSWLDNQKRDATRRRAGKFPTLDSAMEVPSMSDTSSQAAEGAVAPVAAALEVVLFPVRAIVARPWQRTRTGLAPYERSPRSQVITNDPAEFREAPPAPEPYPTEPLYGQDAPNVQGPGVAVPPIPLPTNPPGAPTPAKPERPENQPKK